MDHVRIGEVSRVSGMRREPITAWLAQSAFDSMLAEADRCAPYETGGVLMGYRSSDPEALVIVEIVGPGPDAKHGLTSFAPDHAFQQVEIDRIYIRSDRRITYLGDWHTHPKGVAELSLTDRLTQVRIGRHREARASRAVMAILAGEGLSWSLALWQLQWRRYWVPAFVPMTRVVYDDYHTTPRD
jgi:integrative and conjugative element protein (TIGR02256 family)